MPPVIALVVVAMSASLALLAWGAIAQPGRSRKQVLANLRRGHAPEPVAAPESHLVELPTAGALGAVARRLTPSSSVRLLDRLLGRAGHPAGWTLDRLLAVKIVLPVLVVALTLLFATTTPGPLPFLLGAVVAVVTYFLPELLLHSRAQERSQAIQLELADTLDQMTIAVEAGLGFDSAMARAGKNGKGPLAAELVRTLQDIQVGRSRRQAYETLASRTDVADLRRFIRAIIQADAYGISIADVLRTQAHELRLKRRMRAEQKAMQIPVKVIMPLMLCILPVLFIVLLGPAAINVLDVVGGM